MKPTHDINYDLQWNQYLNDCGHKVGYEKALKKFQSKYHGKSVQWEGYVMRIDSSEIINLASVLVYMNLRDKH